MNLAALQKGCKNSLIIVRMIFPEKMFLIIFSINRLNFIVWLPLLLEILANMCITIICYLLTT